jgi:hypothetical protein
MVYHYSQPSFIHLNMEVAQEVSKVSFLYRISRHSHIGQAVRYDPDLINRLFSGRFSFGRKSTL